VPATIAGRRDRPPAAPPLGGLAPEAFLRRHWQKRARLVRDAVPGYAGPFSRDDLFALACRDDVESRLVVRTGKRWSVDHGPFAPRALASLPPRAWTLLVQGTNLVDARADALMRRFDFIPYARLDDVMVSYAAPGGGVGPHVDAYDVFLLQGFGRRRWRWGAQRDVAFVPDLPLRILSRFAPDHDEVLGPGDMLYLPPQAPRRRRRRRVHDLLDRVPRGARAGGRRGVPHAPRGRGRPVGALRRSRPRRHANAGAHSRGDAGAIRAHARAHPDRSRRRRRVRRRVAHRAQGPRVLRAAPARPADRRVREGARAPRRETGPPHASALRCPRDVRQRRARDDPGGRARRTPPVRRPAHAPGARCALARRGRARPSPRLVPPWLAPLGTAHDVSARRTVLASIAEQVEPSTRSWIARGRGLVFDVDLSQEGWHGRPRRTPRRLPAPCARPAH
jgi:hypothetical protein